MPTTLTFLSWARERIGDLATTTVSGRARGQATVTLSGTDANGTATSSASQAINFLLAGPADVTGLQPGAITGRYPVPGAIDAESDKSSHVELAEATLPWRYAPAGNPAAGTGALHPWLALVVGVEEDELTLVGGQVTLTPAVQALHPLGAGAAFPWAHVQVDGAGRRVARVLSARPLDGGQDYLAVLVPAFSAAGTPAWSGAQVATLPVYDHWRFTTATPAGGFRDLAERLHPGEADPDTGRAPVDYPRVPTAPDLEARGALGPLGSTDAALPAAIASDLAGLLTATTDPQGRPVVGLPRYGDQWHATPSTTTWGGTANGDPRHRGIAGVGAEMGIQLQEDLAADAAAHAGALAVAGQRIRDLVLGLRASAALWERRMPTDPLHRLWILGPALRRVVTDEGTIDELATAGHRALPAGIFSSAARRILRAGPARSAGLQPGALDPGAILATANRCPAPPPRSQDGVVLGDAKAFDERVRAVLEAGGGLDFAGLANVVEALDLSRVPNRARDLVERVRDRLLTSGDAPAPWGPAIELILWSLRVRDEDEKELELLMAALRRLLAEWQDESPGLEDLLVLLGGFDPPRGREPPCSPVDLDALAAGVADAFDPRAETAAVRVRVLAGIDGLDPAQPLAPVEVCVGLDRPVWRDLEATFPEWLLPGVGSLPEDSVIALETNPIFTDALLLGYNQQLLGELRWRNIPVGSGCTPLRVFWERAHTGSGARIDDIVGVAGWSDASPLGAASHRPGGASGSDLVVVVRGQLFLRYPRTLVYLVSAEHSGLVDFEQDPATTAPHVLPTFQGRIGADVTFFGFQGMVPTDIERHWVVFEEPPAGYRFYNVANATVPAGADGATFADVAFADPVRVLIRGDSLAPGGV